MVVGEGFEPSKAEPSDLQSDPFDRSGTPPTRGCTFSTPAHGLSTSHPAKSPKIPTACSGFSRQDSMYRIRSPQSPGNQGKNNPITKPWRSGRRAASGEWCRQWDSNSRPTDYKSVALPTELYRLRARILSNFIRPDNANHSSQAAFSRFSSSCLIS